VIAADPLTPKDRTMSWPKLKAVTRTQGNNQALKDGSVKPQGFELEFEEVPVLIDAFRRMVRGLEYDVCEMALTTYACAREHGTKFTALPIFLVRAFHHGAIVINTDAGIRHPKDLEGRKVGVNRGWTVTTGLWARSILQHQYGVDLTKISWVLSGDEHVQQYQTPARVQRLAPGRKMADLVVSGELAGAIGVEIDAPNVKPLIPLAAQAGLEALRQHGHYPINHLVVVKDEVLKAHPEIGPAVFEAFAESKRRYVRNLRAGTIAKPTAVDEVHRRVMEITGADPLPYGLGPNRAMLQQALRSATEQGILARMPVLEDLFPADTLELTA
jgi:4,5-dihydroxyphthalate decarboxylase